MSASWRTSGRPGGRCDDRHGRRYSRRADRGLVRGADPDHERDERHADRAGGGLRPRRPRSSRYDDEDEAIRIANDSDFGLSGCVFTARLRARIRGRAEIRDGTFSVNTMAGATSTRRSAATSIGHRPRARHRRTRRLPLRRRSRSIPRRSCRSQLSPRWPRSPEFARSNAPAPEHVARGCNEWAALAGRPLDAPAPCSAAGTSIRTSVLPTVSPASIETSASGACSSPSMIVWR